ncbi:hypothetical protein NQ318_016896 [Aromia moschata]|uniref:Mos1 transposase HTH domain-containing protein n=1 Tax=Aromia moschata TaxID=1265417 RepID=A0AAV8XSX8_9CUCU|nr:hypothetical protein NQ318_016896 [Aromia moschata]
MQRSFEQRMAIKFSVKLEKSAAETIPMLKKAFGVDCLSDRQIFRWHKAFADGREDVNDENRAGRPSTSSSDDNVKRVRDLLNTDRSIPETLDITKTIVHEIMSGSLVESSALFCSNTTRFTSQIRLVAIYGKEINAEESGNQIVALEKL